MKYLICNLKAHKTYEQMLEYKISLQKILNKQINLIIAPSSAYLSMFKGTNLNLCIQNLNLNNDLLLTGDISIEQLKSLDVKYAIIGHYERRKFYKENELEILEKIKIATTNNLKVIYCIGETKEEKDRKVEYQILEKQIARIFNKLSNENIKNIIIAYEPTYLIGKNDTYDLLKIRSIILFIKKIVKDYYNINIDVIFGGNINIDNIKNLVNLNVLDGFIICSAILDSQNIPILIDKITIK